MKIVELLNEQELDEALPAIGFGAAVSYILLSLSAGLTIYDLINYAEKEGTWDVTKWSDETKETLFLEYVTIPLALIAAVKVFGKGYKLYKSKFPKGFWKNNDNVKDIVVGGA